VIKARTAIFAVRAFLILALNANLAQLSIGLNAGE
jgi:hypothetical protein